MKVSWTFDLTPTELSINSSTIALALARAVRVLLMSWWSTHQQLMSWRVKSSTVDELMNQRVNGWWVDELMSQWLTSWWKVPWGLSDHVISGWPLGMLIFFASGGNGYGGVTLRCRGRGGCLIPDVLHQILFFCFSRETEVRNLLLHPNQQWRQIVVELKQ